MTEADLATLFRAPRLATELNWALWLALALPVLVLAIRYRRRHRLGRPFVLLAGLMAALTVLCVCFGVEGRWRQAQCWHHRALANEACVGIPPENAPGWYYGDQWFDDGQLGAPRK